MRLLAGSVGPLLGLLLVAGCGGSTGSTGSSGEPTGEPSGAVAPAPVVSSGAVTPPAGSSSGGAPVAPEASADASDQALAQLAEQAAAAAASMDAAGVGPGGPAGDGEPVLGGDISWPQCPKGMGIPEKRSLGLPMPLEEAAYVVVGLTNGPGFVANPCLADQVAWVRERGLLASAYAVSSFPDAATLALQGQNGPFDGSTTRGALGNVGYQQAGFNVASMRAAGLETPVVWIDVEPVPDFAWSDDPVANAAVVRGVARGYTDAGYRIGVYSTPYLWSTVVGDLSLGVPEWRAAGQTSGAEALARCGEEWVIQGGPAVMGQWVADSRDQNLTCPGISTRLTDWFHQY